eukprot:1156480-Pelagomonas_calceolata.AAC.10
MHLRFLGHSLHALDRDDGGKGGMTCIHLIGTMERWWKGRHGMHLIGTTVEGKHGMHLIGMMVDGRHGMHAHEGIVQICTRGKKGTVCMHLKGMMVEGSAFFAMLRDAHS